MRTATAIILIFLASQCVAQGIDLPPTLTGFLKSGTYVGVRAFDGADGIKFTIYSEDDFAIASDARRLEFDKLAAKYDSVRESHEQVLADVVASLESKRDELAPDKEFGEPRAVLSIDPRELLGKIVHSGDDYILFAYGDDLEKRRVFAVRFISTIHWHKELRFNTSVRHVKKTADRSQR